MRWPVPDTTAGTECLKKLLNGLRSANLTGLSTRLMTRVASIVAGGCPLQPAWEILKA